MSRSKNGRNHTECMFDHLYESMCRGQSFGDSIRFKHMYTSTAISIATATTILQTDYNDNKNNEHIFSHPFDHNQFMERL